MALKELKKRQQPSPLVIRVLKKLKIKKKKKKKKVKKKRFKKQ